MRICFMFLALLLINCLAAFSVNHKYTIESNSSSYSSSSSSSSNTTTNHITYGIPSGLQHPVITDITHHISGSSSSKTNSSLHDNTTLFVDGVDQTVAVQPIIILGGCQKCAKETQRPQPINCNQYGCIDTNGSIITNVMLQPVCNYDKGLICVKKIDCVNGFLVAGQADSYQTTIVKNRNCDKVSEVCCSLQNNVVGEVNNHEKQEILENANNEDHVVIENVDDSTSKNKETIRHEGGNLINNYNQHYDNQVISNDNSYMHPKINVRPNLETIHLTSSKIADDQPVHYVFQGDGYLPPPNEGSESKRDEVYEGLLPPVVAVPVSSTTTTDSVPTITRDQLTRDEVYEGQSRPVVVVPVSSTTTTDSVPTITRDQLTRDEVYEGQSRPVVVVPVSSTTTTNSVPTITWDQLPRGCAAALMCVAEDYCSKNGVISQERQNLSDSEKQFRVPLSDCYNMTTQTVGKCCRDPNYVDPWPASILGQYNPDLVNFNNGGYSPNPEASNINKHTNVAIDNFYQPTRTDQQSGSSFDSKVVSNSDVKEIVSPYSFNTTFGEIPWQAMILNDASKTILCGGVILDSKHVLTTAKCVQSLAVGNLAVKGGEWELGRDVQQETKPFQIRKVYQVIYHPNGQNVVILELDTDFIFDWHLDATLIDDFSQIGSLTSTDYCFVTGWGKAVLQSHLLGARMHRIMVDFPRNEDCPKELKTGINTKYGKPLNGYDVCDADLGSGLMCGNENKGFKLYGIYDNDNGCRNSNQWASFTAIDIKWCYQYINRYEHEHEGSSLSYVTYNHQKRKVKKVCKCVEEEVFE